MSSTDRSAIKGHYIAKLVSNLGSFFLNFLTAGIIPRMLGPAAYGNLQYLTEFFKQASSLFDMGFSSYFYANLSRNPKDRKLIIFYFSIIIVSSVLLFLAVNCAIFLGFEHDIWPGQNTKYIILASFLGVITLFSQPIVKMADAFYLSIPLEIIKLLQKIIGVGILLSIYYFDLITLENVFWYRIFLGILILAGIVYIIVRDSKFKELEDSERKYVDYVTGIFKYSHPLITYTIFLFFISIADRWILQKFAGSTEQGFYGLAFGLSGICFMFTSALTPIVQREFSISHGKNNSEEIRQTFEKALPLFYSITCYFSAFLLINSRSIVHVIGGEKYTSAILAMQIMMLYPIHQTYGQINGSLFMATDKTKLFRNIGLVSSVIGIFISYLLIAPSKYFGLDLGANGLAVKTVVLQFVTVNIQLYYLSRIFKFDFKGHIFNQFGRIFFYFFIAIVIHSLFKTFAVDSLSNIILVFFAEGMVYTSVIIICICKFPYFIGMGNEQFAHYYDTLIEKIRKLSR